MSWKTPFGWLLAGCVAALTGCSTRPAAIEPTATISVSLDATKKTNNVTVERANRVALAFPASDRPGYHWQISFHDTRYLKQLSEITAGVDPNDGARVSFLALKTGRTRLRFVLVPPSGAREVDPVDQQEVVLTIE